MAEIGEPVDRIDGRLKLTGAAKMTKATDARRLRDAARALGISYPTLKQWIYARKIRSVQTSGGHHRIPQEEIERILGGKNDEDLSRSTEPTKSETVGGRNKLSGRVIEVRDGGLLAQVVIDIGMGQQMFSVITSSCVRNLNLRRGINVCAYIKATEVMIARA